MRKQKIEDEDRQLLKLVIHYYEREIKKRLKKGTTREEILEGNFSGVNINNLVMFRNWNKYKLLYQFAKLDHAGQCELIGEHKVQLLPDEIEQMVNALDG